ncbi:tail fiber domain-containing protein, partial [Flavobacterium notoginsengisoli]
NLIITYTDGRTFDAGKVKGDTGAKGETGAKGDTGTGISSTVIDPATGNLIITYTDGRTFDAGKVKGDTGAKGETGAKGDTGTGISSTVIDPATGNLIITYTDGRTFDAGKVKGNKGDDGAVGPQGPQGIAGTNGADGAVGPQGPQGIAGTNGADGAVGPQGPQGIAGTNGADGAVGPQGPQGIPGTNGIDGADGPQGPQGIAGTNGADGAVGPQGPQGIPGTNGIDGADGAVGPQGPQGIAGTNGADGAVGPQGPQGIPGTNGIDGAVGPQGPQGIAGTNGIDGANGPQGPQGIPGTNGADGAVGPQGLQGIPGTNGADGSVGPQGPQGIAGTNGAVGPQGLRGIPGTNGADGAVGPQGPQGPKGETGATPTITKGSVVAGSTSVLVTGTGKVLDANITVDVVKKNLTSTTSNKVLAIVGGTSTTLADTQINLVPAVNKPAYLYTDQNGAVAWSPDMPWVLGGNDGSDGLTSEKKFGTLTNFDIPFFTNNTEKMRLTKTGLLGIGTSKPRYGIHLVNETNTTADDNKDDLKLSTYSTAAVSPSFSFLKSNGTEATPTPMTSGMAMGAFNFQAQTTNGDANGLGGFQSLTSVTAYYEGGSGSSAKSNLEFKTSNTLNLEIANNGDLLPGTTATTGTINLGNINQRWRALYAANGTIQTSDIRLKQNIKPLNYGLIDVLKIDPISYTWKSDKFDKVKLGVSAQQLQTILPEIVEVGTDDAKILGVNYADMIPVLINAIKEQQKQIDELKNEIKEMKSKQ